MLLALFDYWAPFYSNKPASGCNSDLEKLENISFANPEPILLQSIFGEAGERAEGSTGGLTPGTLTARDQGAGAAAEGPAVTIISAKVIISSTRSEEGKLLLKYFSRMTARIHENCTAPLPRAVTIRVLKPNLLRQKK